ncbi:RE1-silencing transcription factor-like isoform X2 [Leptidea sinapis]|uniref:RE1-silencing transcription factor-like isoform X2 n=1 Tax=Leptidea sinapis TaxID=189913 RepID=UPI002122389C|nr:RE1-silencing transcription factor-like isoform X2 [Leptidea sinapis]
METRREALCGFNVCRFCLSPAGPLLNLYDKNQISKESTNLKLKILTCLSIEIFPSDKMPQYICARCKYFMTTFYEFKKICRQADEIILNYLQRGTPLRTMPYPRVLQKLFKNSTHIKTMKTVVEGSTVQVSSQDTSDTEDEDGNVYNVKINGPDDENNTACIKVVTSAEPEIPKGTRKDSTDRSPETEVEEGCFACNECDRTYPLEQLLQLHKQQKHRPRNVECELCDAKFFNKYDLAAHQLRHSDEMPFQCVVCQKKFKRLILLKRHEKLVHSDLPQLNCPSCPATFLSLDQLSVHQQKHVGSADRSYVCLQCNKSYSDRSALARHKLTVHDKNPEFACQYCPERFSSVSKLTRHIRSHAGDRPYPCKFCEKSFTKSQHYTRHLRVVHRKNSTAASEVEAESYRCEECEETFTSQDDLIFHSAVHATQNLTCPLCQEKFATVDDVTAHIKSHVNGLEFMCDFCELVFTSKEKLDNHIASAHEEEFENEMDQTQEDSMDADPEDDEDDTGIRVKEDGDNMVIEINKAHDFMMPEDQDDNEDRNDNTYSEDSEVDATFIDMPLTEGSPVKKVSIIVPENTSPAVASEMKIIPAQNRVRKQMKTMSPNVTASAVQTKIAEAVSTPAKDQASLLPSKLDAKVNEQAPHIIRKAEEVKRKALPQVEPSSAKKVIAKAESNNASDKSLRLLEKELQDLKRTNSRTEASKTPQSKPTEMLKGKQRSQIITSTPKTRLTEEKKSQLSSKPVAIEKKQVERRVTKENKEPKESKETKNNNKEEEKEPKDTPKSAIKNGDTDQSNSEEIVRRSTRPSRIKDYAKMISDTSKANSDDDDTDADDEEYVDTSATENRSKRRTSIKPKVQNSATTTATPGSTPGARKRGRPRKERKEIPKKAKKTDEESEKEQEEADKTLNKEGGAAEMLDDGVNGSQSPSKAYPDDNPEKPASTLLKSPSGQTLKKIPMKTLPPGIKAEPLPAGARSAVGPVEVSEMHIGQKLVKVKKIVMTKSEVEQMAKRGLVEMKNGTMVLKQGIKLPQAESEVIKGSKELQSALPMRCNFDENQAT